MHRIHIAIQKRRKRDTVRKYWMKVRLKATGQNSDPEAPGLMSNSSEGSALPALLTATHFALLGWSHSCKQLSMVDIPWIWHL